MQFEGKYKVGVREIGKDNKLSNIGMLGFLEEVASEHSALAGYGINDIPKTRRVWLLMDWKLKIMERPIYGDVLTIKTWSRLPSSCPVAYTYRDFEIYVENKLVAIATSKWVMIDADTGRIVKITDEMIKGYDSEDKHVFGEKEIEKLISDEEFSNKVCYEVRKADIDMNKHVHNLNYLNIAYEAMPEEIYENKEFPNVRIMYKKQIKFGEKVNVLYTCKNGKHKFCIKSENDKVLHAIIELN